MSKVDEDKRFEIFSEIEKNIALAYPQIHSKLTKENVNNNGLLYTWKGSDPSLKPILLMAHQDVVPVEESTSDSWDYPPFSGHYDGKYVWGRGSVDCKGQLAAVLGAVEALIENGFEPKRTVLLSFGFDEEISGRRGGVYLAARILELFNKHGIAAIIDEGSGIYDRWNATFAIPGVSEKGYTDVKITVRMPGGHSSKPTPHTSIGVISELITSIEAEQYPPSIFDENPTLGLLQCGARYGPTFPQKLKQLLSERNRRARQILPNTFENGDALAEEFVAQEPFLQYLVQTAQAIDLISGGTKVNALPEQVEASINHRVNIGESTSVPQDRISQLAAKVAKRHNLTLIAFPKDKYEVIGSSIELTTPGTDLEPAPATPVDLYIPGTKHLSQWGILSGTVRGLYGERVTVSPGLTTGNTDTKHFWDVSKHIFRFAPGYDPMDETLGSATVVHTVNERQSVVAHINAIKFFTGFIKNADDAAF